MAKHDWVKIDGRWVRKSGPVQRRRRSHRPHSSASAHAHTSKPRSSKADRKSKRAAAEAAYDKASRCKHGAAFCDACDEDPNPRWSFGERIRRGEEARRRVLES